MMSSEKKKKKKKKLACFSLISADPDFKFFGLKHILFRKIFMYNIYCDNINTLGYERKQNAYIVLLL